MAGIPVSLYLLGIRPSLSGVATGRVGDAYSAVIVLAKLHEPSYVTSSLDRLLSRKSVTILGRRTVPELSTLHIGKGVALVAPAATLVYI
jgi:hypothetical protein